MSAGKLFHNRAPAVAKALSPTVAHCDWQTSSMGQVSHEEVDSTKT